MRAPARPSAALRSGSPSGCATTAELLDVVEDAAEELAGAVTDAEPDPDGLRLDPELRDADDEADAVKLGKESDVDGDEAAQNCSTSAWAEATSVGHVCKQP